MHGDLTLAINRADEHAYLGLNKGGHQRHLHYAVCYFHLMGMQLAWLLPEKTKYNPVATWYIHTSHSSLVRLKYIQARNNDPFLTNKRYLPVPT